jgi:hypothetical protein
VTLILAADASTPVTPAQLGAEYQAILGYVGEAGMTPHVWTPAEVDAARAGGMWFGPIWTPSQSGLDAAHGTAAAQSMLAVLPSYGVPKGSAVFLDTEKSAWDLSVPETAAAVDAWGYWMRKGGYVPYPYVAWEAIGAVPAVWAAWYTYQRPTALPQGVIGWQFSDQGGGGAWDISVFDASLPWWGKVDPPSPPTYPKEANVTVLNAGEGLPFRLASGTAWIGIGSGSAPNLLHFSWRLDSDPKDTWRKLPGGPASPQPGAGNDPYAFWTPPGGLNVEVSGPGVVWVRNYDSVQAQASGADVASVERAGPATITVWSPWG